MNLGRDPGTGKQKRRSVYGDTQQEVRKKLAELTQDRDDGLYVDPSLLTVGQWFDVWSKQYLLNVRSSTRDLYEQEIRLYIKPNLGAVKISKLNGADIQAVYKRLSDNLSPKSVKNIHGILHKGLEQAVKNGIIKVNPSDSCELPKMERKEIKPLDESQQKAFLKAINGHVHEDLYKVALFTGIREGEILGLMWSRIDFKAGTITIDQQLRKETKKAASITTHRRRMGKVGF